MGKLKEAFIESEAERQKKLNTHTIGVGHDEIRAGDVVAYPVKRKLKESVVHERHGNILALRGASPIYVADVSSARRMVVNAKQSDSHPLCEAVKEISCHKASVPIQTPA